MGAKVFDVEEVPIYVTLFPELLDDILLDPSAAFKIERGKANS
jgi:hypothetical protein